MNENKIDLRIQLLTTSAKVPCKGSADSAGVDLIADLPREEVIIGESEWKLIPTGIAIELPRGCEAQVRPRSGLALKKGLTVLNSPGTIDSDYRGEVGVILYNAGKVPQVIKHGDRVAQLVVSKIAPTRLVVCKSLSDTDRGKDGFGSTGE